MSKSEKKKQKKAAQQQAISTPAQPAAKPGMGFALVQVHQVQ
jgi:hypothetical protein